MVSFAAALLYLNFVGDRRMPPKDVGDGTLFLSRVVDRRIPKASYFPFACIARIIAGRSPRFYHPQPSRSWKQVTQYWSLKGRCPFQRWHPLPHQVKKREQTGRTEQRHVDGEKWHDRPAAAAVPARGSARSAFKRSRIRRKRGRKRGGKGGGPKRAGERMKRPV